MLWLNSVSHHRAPVHPHRPLAGHFSVLPTWIQPCSLSMVSAKRERVKQKDGHYPPFFIAAWPRLFLYWQTCCRLKESRSVLLMRSMPPFTTLCRIRVEGVSMPTNSVGHLKVITTKGFSPVG